MPDQVPSNFRFLEVHDAQLVRFGMLAEKYFADDPNTCLMKLRQFGEVLAQLVASRAGLYTSSEEPQSELLRRLQGSQIVPREIATLFHEVKNAGNAASHRGDGDHRTALAVLRFSWQLGVWYHRTFQDKAFKSGPFLPPVAPKDESEALRAELARLNQALEADRATHQQTAAELAATRARLEAAQQDQSFWEGMASEAEQAKAALEQRLKALQATALAKPPDALGLLVQSANQAAEQVELDEADTREIIDRQLRAAGWEADSAVLRYGRGARPEKGRNLAIAEWPTTNGPADYVLFVGLMPVAAIEAKRENIDVSAALQQAKRYSRGFTVSPELATFGGPWGEYGLPFVFSSNGRPYLKQIASKSGVWFCDVRRSHNLARPLESWHTPGGLKEMLKQDAAQADAALAVEPFEYGFPLRPYQRSAIQAVERVLATGVQRQMLRNWLRIADSGSMPCSGRRRLRISRSSSSRRLALMHWRNGRS